MLKKVRENDAWKSVSVDVATKFIKREVESYIYDDNDDDEQDRVI